tara:strand:+ start:130 stop:1635 length:1506 start_codon:yes stop_codon:yes gene_type:complete
MGKKLNFFQRAARSQKKQNERKKNARLAAERREIRKENTRRRNEAKFRQSSNRSKNIVKHYDYLIDSLKMMYRPGRHNYGYKYTSGENKKVAIAGNYLFQKFITKKDVKEIWPSDDTSIAFDMMWQMQIEGGYQKYNISEDSDEYQEFFDPNFDSENFEVESHYISTLQAFLPAIFPLDFFRTLGPDLEKNNGNPVLIKELADENFTTIHTVHPYHDPDDDDYPNQILLDIELNGLDPDKMKNGQYFLNEYGARITSSGNNHSEFRHTPKYQEDIANSAICSMAIAYAQHTFSITRGRLDYCCVRISCDGIDDSTGNTINNYLLSVKFKPSDFKKMNLSKIDPIKAIDSLESTRKNISSNKKIKFAFDEDDFDIERDSDGNVLWEDNTSYFKLGGEGSIMNSLYNQWELFFNEKEFKIYKKPDDPNEIYGEFSGTFKIDDIKKVFFHSADGRDKYIFRDYDQAWWWLDQLMKIDKEHEKIKDKVFTEKSWKSTNLMFTPRF